MIAPIVPASATMAMAATRPGVVVMTNMIPIVAALRPVITAHGAGARITSRSAGGTGPWSLAMAARIETSAPELDS